MFRILLIITLIMIALPYLTKAKDYAVNKARSAKAVGEVVGKAIKISH